jgi:hypothetical protein
VDLRQHKGEQGLRVPVITKKVSEKAHGGESSSRL